MELETIRRALFCFRKRRLNGIVVCMLSENNYTRNISIKKSEWKEEFAK